MVGSKVSHFKIIEQLGKGGMGIVYKAKDTRLDRIVALKLLPKSLLSTSSNKARFEREAKAAAKLNHPNIAHVYEIDETGDGQPFIAMEYVEGETIAERILRGPLPLKDALLITKKVAEGLQVAHEAGIIHRDINSNNIMLTNSNQVKIMDFGLVRITGASMLTKEGIIMGTAPYMSPEQANGKKIDHRSDIWSLGVVLYEMISGQLPFKGDYESAIIYSILNAEPEPLTGLRSKIPIAIDSIINKALAKDPDIRYQHVDELKADLKGVEIPSNSTSAIVHSEINSYKSVKGYVFIAGLIIASMSIGYFMSGGLLQSFSSKTVVQRYSITLPESAPLAPVGSANLGIGQRALVISPDGNTLVYAADIGGQTQLYKRPINSHTIYPIPDTKGAYYPFFSPDGQWIGFFTDNELKKIPLSGDKAITLCSVVNARGADWTNDGKIIFASHEARNLFEVPSGGGTPYRINDTPGGAHRYVNPDLLPDGKHIMTSPRNGGIVITNIENGSQKFLDIDGINFSYIPGGYLVYVKDDHLEAVKFMWEELIISGKPLPVFSDVRIMPTTRWKQWIVSNDGLVIYLSSTAGVTSELVWKQRNGGVKSVGLTFEHYGRFKLSPDNDQLAYDSFSESTGWQTWIYHFKQNSQFKIPLEGQVSRPIWSRDGSWIAARYIPYNSESKSILWFTGPKRQMKELNNINGTLYSFSPDDRLISGTGAPDLFIYDRIEGKIVETYGDSLYNEWGNSFSPDGKWIAYTSDEQGQYNVYVEPYPKTGERWRVSPNGGEEPVWSDQTNELFYRFGRKWFSVKYESKNTFSFRDPDLLFEGDYINVPGISYEVDYNGNRFLLLRQPVKDNYRTLNVVTNWFDELTKKFAE